MAESATVSNNKLAHKFYCETCDYTTSKKSSYETHNLSAKHIKQQSATYKNQEHNCTNCNRKYQDRTGLWRHKKLCCLNGVIEPNIVEQMFKQNDDFKHLILEQNKMFVEQNIELQKQSQEMQKHSNELQKQNSELQKQILDVCKNGVISNNTVNSHNKTFNLQVFLNEDCKDAMNINEFIESIQFQLADLEQMGKIGYVDGISNIIIKNLKALDIHKRPVHCTDQKRETIYIKDEGVWIKEDDDNKNVRKLIKRVAFRNPPLEKVEPNAIDLVQPFPKVDKIIRKIAMEMTIDKNKL